MTMVKLICADTIDGMRTLESESIDLIVTSPPYNVNKEYEQDVDNEEYLKLITKACNVFRRVLKPDGRFCINVPFTMGSHSIIRPVMYEWERALLDAGLTIRDYMVWNQSNPGNDTAWGSFASASSPWLRHQTEVIIVGYNDQWKKLNKGESDISNRDFTRWTVDHWTMPTARCKWHPAVFPEELPKRCIQLFSYVEDVILDPFVGSGTTLRVGRDLKRNVIGIEKQSEYCDKIRQGSGFNQATLDKSVEYVYEVV